MFINVAEAMDIVDTICNMRSTNCRSLNKVGEALKLFEMVGINTDEIRIHEIPLDWDGQVVVLFTYYGEYYELFVGRACEGNEFFFEFRIDNGDGTEGELVPYEFFLNNSRKMREHIAQAQDGIAYLFPYVDSKTLDVLIDMCQTLDEIESNLYKKEGE